MKYLRCFGLVLLGAPAFAQAKLNLPLKRELDSILVQDQKYRELMAGMNNGKTDSLETALHLPKGQLFTYALTNMNCVDSSGMRRVEAIVRRYGYPGQSLVGASTNEAAWLVIQHSGKIPQYLPLIKAAAEKGELPYRLYAQMLDRKLMNDGLEQLYGTQGVSFTVPNRATGKRETASFIWPIKDAARVNERRKQTGFPGTVEESAATLGIPYKPVALEYAKRLQRQSQTK